MRTINTYITKKIIVINFIMLMAITLLLVFLQGSKYVDLVVTKGLSPSYLLLMTFLTMPSVWNEVLPITLFLSIMITWYNLLHNHELIVLQTLGLDPFTLFRPMLWSGIVTALICFILSYNLMNISYLEYNKLRAKVANSFNLKVVDDNKFTQITDDTTIYIGTNNKGGSLSNILINTVRGNKEYTIYAQTARVLKDGNSIKILLNDGSIQSSNLVTKAVDFINFKIYVFTIPHHNSPATNVNPASQNPRGLSLGRLINYGSNSHAKNAHENKIEQASFVQEATGRMSNILLALLLPIILIYFCSRASFKRGTQVKPIVQSVTAVFILKGVCIWAVFMVSSLLYVFLLFGALTGLGMLVLTLIAREHRRFA